MSTEHPNEKVALVTGGGRGIGRAIALELAKCGFSLCIAARTLEQLEETRRLSRLPAAQCMIVLADLAEPDSPACLIETAIEHFGRLDALINNAGWGPSRRPLVKTSESDQDRMIALNLRAPITLTRLAIPHMIARGSGTIVNVASEAGRRCRSGEAVYCATKAALIAFTRACFAELGASGIKISAVIPGLVDTALIPSSKRLDRSLMLRPEDVARSVVRIIVESDVGTCPVEVALQPPRDPERGR